MKIKLFAGAAVLVLGTYAAQAADFAAVYKGSSADVDIWTGPYVGLGGGLARHEAQFSDLTGLVGTAGNTLTTIRSGALAGGFAGYNWRHRSFVFGIEGDMNWVGASVRETTGAQNSFSISGVQNQDTNWLATMRARGGIEVESTLIYLTGGLAVAGVENSYARYCPPAGFCSTGTPNSLSAAFSRRGTQVGWTAGLGVEHLVDSYWLVRAEARYTDLGRSSVVCRDAGVATLCQTPGDNYRGAFSDTLLTGLIGVGYKF